MTVQPTRDQLRALADKATEGPWNPHPAGKYVWTEDLGGIIQNWSDDANAVADMEFIAAARNVLPQILDQLDQAEARIDRWRDYGRTQRHRADDQEDRAIRAVANWDAAKRRVARLEAQTSIRGRAVVMYRERARQAETRIRDLTQEVKDERGAALDLIEQVKIRDARIKAVRDEHRNDAGVCSSCITNYGFAPDPAAGWRTVPWPCATIRALD